MPMVGVGDEQLPQHHLGLKAPIWVDVGFLGIWAGVWVEVPDEAAQSK